MKRVLFFVFILITCLQAEEESESACLSNYEGDISGIVNGVCVISGDYNLNDSDYVIPGTTPIEYQRSYNSHDIHREEEGSMEQLNGPSWKNNCYSKVTAHDIKWGNYNQALVFHAPLKGQMIFLERDIRNNLNFKFDINYPANSGYTNTGSGSPIGKSHIKTVNIPSKTKYDSELYFDLQDGSHHYYRCTNLNSKHTHLIYHPIDFTLPNGNAFLYGYSCDCTKLTSVLLWNKTRNTCFGGITLQPIHDTSSSYSNKIVFSDGKEVKFAYIKLPVKVREKDKDFYYLKSVERPNQPKVEFEYAGRNARQRTLSKVIHPDGRFQEINYYIQGSNSLLDKRFKFDVPKKSKELYRVKEIKAPSTFDGKATTTHAFVYNFKYFYDQKNKPHFRGGNTVVYDANHHLTIYHYDKFHCLTDIHKYSGTKRREIKFYSREHLEWDTGGKLTTKFMIDANHHTHYIRKYLYDPAGNVIQNIYFGNLSGQGSPMVANKHGKIVLEGIEKWSKEYTYDNTKFHHILSETEGNRAIFFEYVPDTTLLAAKITKCGGYTVAREYYTYDENATLIEAISDDGTSSFKDDFSGVTQRLITRTLPRPTGHGIGLPLEQWNLYIDLDTGEEKLLSHHINTYNDDYRLVSCEHYDSEDHYLYTLTWEYDRYGNVIAETDPLGYKTFRQYDENSNLVWEQSPSGILTKEHTYDYCNRLIRTNMIGADGTIVSTTNTYDTMGRLMSAQNHRGETTSYIYDEFDRLISLKSPEIYNAKGQLVTPIETYTYDAVGRKTSSTDGRGFTTRKEYNAYGSVTRTIHADGTEESAIYHLDNTIKESKAKNGTVTKYVFDTLKRPTSIEVYDAAGNLLSKTKNTYNTFHLLSKTHPNGTVITYGYDGAGRLISESVEDKLTTYEYDTQSRRCATINHIDGDARVTRVVYDLKGQIIEERTENLAGEVFTKEDHLYDAEGRKTRTTIYGTNGATTTTTEYDPFGRVTCITDNEGQSVITLYDEFFVDEEGHKGCLFTQIDPLGVRTLTLYDALGRMVKIEKQGITGETLSLSKRFYDLAGNLAEERHTIITPGKANRLIVNMWEYNSYGKPLVQIEAYKSERQRAIYYTYDKAGQLIKTTLPYFFTIIQAYDALGRLTERSSLKGEISQQFAYDLAGNPVLVKSHEGTIERKYDTLNRMTEEKLAHGHVIGYSYDVFNRITEIVLPDQSTINYVYNPMHLKAVIRGSKIHTYDTYDLHGNLIAATLATGEKATYGYNTLGRLESIETPRWSEKQITYDPLGNITSFIIGDQPCSYAYDELSQLTEERGVSEHSYQHDSIHNRTQKDGAVYTLNALNEVLSAGHEEYSYDTAGNLIKGDGFSYSYDPLGRMTRVTDGKEITYNYTYDPFNRRISSNDIDFIYQGEMEIGAIRNGKIIELRILGKGRGAEGGAAVLLEIDGKSYTPLHDHNGHCAALLNDKEVVEKYRYSAFGEEEKSEYINPWRFSSKRHDPTGLINFGRRYYHPKMGRWITTDPQGYSEGPNLYAYCGNNPLVKFDLYGLFMLRFNSPSFSMDHENDYYCHKHSSLSKQTLNLSRQMIGLGRSAIGLGRFGVGRGIELMSHHLSPFSEGYNPGAIAGRLIKGDGFQRYSAEYQPLKYDIINKGGCAGKRPLILINGILNSYGNALLKAENLSNKFGGREVHLIYSPTEGFARDGSRVSDMWFDKSSPESDKVNEIVRDYSKNDPNHPGFDIYGESRGSMVVGQVQQTMPSQYRERVKLITMGGKVLYNDGYGNVECHIAYRDPVPYICDFIAIRWAQITKPEHVKFYESDHHWVHDFDDPNKPYQQVYKEHARKFNE